MCDICLHSPCLNVCPNSAHTLIKGYCKQCKSEIREDCTYWKDYIGYIYCSRECAIQYNEITENEWSDKYD